MGCPCGFRHCGSKPLESRNSRFMMVVVFSQGFQLFSWEIDTNAYFSTDFKCRNLKGHPVEPDRKYDAAEAADAGHRGSAGRPLAAGRAGRAVEVPRTGRHRQRAQRTDGRHEAEDEVMKAIDVFAGVGGMHLAADRAGLTPTGRWTTCSTRSRPPGYFSTAGR